MGIDEGKTRTSLFAGFVMAQEATLGTYEAFEAAYKTALNKYKTSPGGTVSRSQLEQEISKNQKMLRNHR